MAELSDLNGGWPTLAPETERQAVVPTSAAVQARVEGAATGDTVEFFGERFRIAEDTGIMPLLMFAASAENGLDSRDMSGLAAMWAMVKDCIADEVEWRRFVRHAVVHKAKADDLMTVVNRTVEIITARPTTPPGDSSAGRDTTSGTSKAPSSPLPQPASVRVPDDASELISIDELVDRSKG